MKDLKLELKKNLVNHKSDLLKKRITLKNYSDYRNNLIISQSVRENFDKETRKICNAYINNYGREFFTQVEKIYKGEIKKFSKFLSNPLE